jgi:acyl phosphate:glycerol-3-phosphate acyltransferase
MNILFWTSIGFLLGALPFSLWVGQALTGSDIRAIHDGNPGAANVFRSGGWKAGAVALVLDWGKGFLPVYLAQSVAGVGGWGILPVALAPVLGHAFSPFLRFHGGKSLATSFGIWTALTLVAGPFILGFLLSFFFVVQDNHGWAVVLTFLAFLLYLSIRGLNWPLLGVWTVDITLLIWKYRAELQRGLNFHSLPVRKEGKEDG